MVSWARALVAKTAAAAREAKMDFMVVEESVDDGGQTRDERVVTWKKTTGGKKGQRSNYKPTSLLFTHKQAITKACPHGNNILSRNSMHDRGWRGLESQSYQGSHAVLSKHLNQVFRGTTDKDTWQHSLHVYFRTSPLRGVRFQRTLSAALNM